MSERLEQERERELEEDERRDMLRRHAPASEPLTGVKRILAAADDCRREDRSPRPHALYNECVEAFRRGEIRFDEVTPLYRHAMIHAGAIRPLDRPRFLVCPRCEARLD